MESKEVKQIDFDSERVFLHDLASPLMVAAGWLERWLRRDPSIGPAPEFSELREQIDRLHDLVAARRDWLLRKEGEE